MAELGRHICPVMHRNFDAVHRYERLQRLPLVEFVVRLVDKDRRAITMHGVVREGSDFLRAVRLLAEQNGGITIANKDGNYIERIVFPDLNNFSVEFPQFYRKGGLPFRIKDGNVEWSSLSESFVNGNTFATISDDRQYTRDMPDREVLSKLGVAGGGGCGGAKEEKEILMSPALAMALANPETEFSYNPGTGEIREVYSESGPIMVQDFFQDRPDGPPGMGAMAVGSRQPPGTALPHLQFAIHEARCRPLAGTIEAADVWQREAYRRERLGAEERVNGIFMGYSSRFLSNAAPDANGEPRHDAPCAGASDSIQGFVLAGCRASAQKAPASEDSPLMRLLMNPTERKIWGKLYGLPDEEEAREAKHASPLMKAARAEAPVSDRKDDGGERKGQIAMRAVPRLGWRNVGKLDGPAIAAETKTGEKTERVPALRIEDGKKDERAFFRKDDGGEKGPFGIRMSPKNRKRAAIKGRGERRMPISMKALEFRLKKAAPSAPGKLPEKKEKKAEGRKDPGRARGRTHEAKAPPARGRLARARKAATGTNAGKARLPGTAGRAKKGPGRAKEAARPGARTARARKTEPPLARPGQPVLRKNRAREKKGMHPHFFREMLGLTISRKTRAGSSSGKRAA